MCVTPLETLECKGSPYYDFRKRGEIVLRINKGIPKIHVIFVLNGAVVQLRCLLVVALLERYVVLFKCLFY